MFLYHTSWPWSCKAMCPVLKVAKPGQPLNLLPAISLFQSSVHKVVSATVVPFRISFKCAWFSMISALFHSPTGFGCEFAAVPIKSYNVPARWFSFLLSSALMLSNTCISNPVLYVWLYFAGSSCTRKIMPLLASGEAFHSHLKSKLEYSLSVTRSPRPSLTAGFNCNAPSSTVHAAPAFDLP